jgi:hypothetical protein
MGWTSAASSGFVVKVEVIRAALYGRLMIKVVGFGAVSRLVKAAPEGAEDAT